MKKPITFLLMSGMVAMSACAEREVVTFGHYEQDGNSDNGPEAIEWLVLDEKEQGKLLISKSALSAQKYYTAKEAVTWADSTLRNWLNDTFLKTAFTEEEQAKIIELELSTAQNSTFFTVGGQDSTDKVFVLSVEEAEKYFKDRFDLITPVTTAAINEGAFADSEGNGIWWLRTPGRWSTFATIVGYYGNIDMVGQAVNYTNAEGKTPVAVRPAIWLQK